MKIAYYVKKRSLKNDGRVEDLLSRLDAIGVELYDLSTQSSVLKDTDAILSFGGDGTLLTAASLAALSEVPIFGVNMGRLGFLSSNTPDAVVKALENGAYEVEERVMLNVSTDCPGIPGWSPLALNEISVSRAGLAMLGVEVSVDGVVLPTYWADGLLVSTSSGSTAYNLSAGGPICMPDARVLIVTPIAPHNLNVRPLVVPDSARIGIGLRSRESRVVLSLDNRHYDIPAGTSVDVMASPVRLKMLRLGDTGFINALRSRLLWGMDVRNSNEQ